MGSASPVKIPTSKTNGQQGRSPDARIAQPADILPPPSSVAPEGASPTKQLLLPYKGTRPPTKRPSSEALAEAAVKAATSRLNKVGSMSTPGTQSPAGGSPRVEDRAENRAKPHMPAYPSAPLGCSQAQKETVRRYFLQPHVSPDAMEGALRATDAIGNEEITSRFQVRSYNFYDITANLYILAALLC